MKTIIASMFLILSACATAPGIKVVTDPKALKGCEGIPTFAPVTCSHEKSCEGCTTKLSEEVGKLGGNAMLLQKAGRECTATPFKCAK